jgi:hypothetical protein
MPPLLAALLMMELSCDIRIVQAIDLSMEWRVLGMSTSFWADSWYDGHLGRSFDKGYWWPHSQHKSLSRRYK